MGQSKKTEIVENLFLDEFLEQGYYYEKYVAEGRPGFLFRGDFHEVDIAQISKPYSEMFPGTIRVTVSVDSYGSFKLNEMEGFVLGYPFLTIEQFEECMVHIHDVFPKLA